ncbi:hypothetical protein IV203_037225 [Nitzschia inconspicua]|uniref:Uncharacterized protein n=1 Tax=Nitzschia inconspicua TaxID=303405 RepID=A0A9K3LLR7_9STRA|nr:hypothetical protein IV203_037225 [Nitzschia inconspicua]
MPRSTSNRRSSSSSSSSSPSAKRRLDFDDTGNNSLSATTRSPTDDDKHNYQLGNDHTGGPRTAFSSSSASTLRVVEADGTPAKKKTRLVDSYFSPVSRKSTDTTSHTAVAIVTPEKVVDTTASTGRDRTTSSINVDDTQPAYVPTYIHQNLSYQRRGKAQLSSTMKQTFALVEEHYVIPNDFETNMKYGPLSGTCFEERVVDAYNDGLLQYKSSKPETHTQTTTATAATTVDICSHCAAMGHKRIDCPELV